MRLQAGAGSMELPKVAAAAPLPQLGINMPALAVPNGGADRAEEVIVCFGIIDILQVRAAALVPHKSFSTAVCLPTGKHPSSPAAPGLLSFARTWC
jgi:hypothetical protein